MTPRFESTHLIDQGRVASHHGAYDRAEQCFRAAIDHARNDREPIAYLETALSNLAMFFHVILDRYAEAEALYMQALPLVRQIHGTQGREVSNYLTFLADAQIRQGNWAAARVTLEEFMAIATSTYGAIDPATERAYAKVTAALHALPRVEAADSDVQP
jgi:tetratricopeptide (TPR) repeat protein